MTNSSDQTNAGIREKRRNRRRTPQWVKTLGSNERLRGVLCYLISSYIRFVVFTGRWTFLGEEHTRPYWDKSEPFILGFWHGRLLMMPVCWHSSMPMNVLISDHRDGAIISQAIGNLGMGTIRGSSSTGGARALRAMVKAVGAGQSLAISPDGPTGPMMRASDGICVTARLSGAPIIPVTFAAHRRKVMKSWDRFVVPLPFSRGVFMWGEPIHIDRRATADEVEHCRARVEQALIDLTREADILVGAQPILPPDETARG